MQTKCIYRLSEKSLMAFSDVGVPYPQAEKFQGPTHTSYTFHHPPKQEKRQIFLPKGLILRVQGTSHRRFVSLSKKNRI